MAMKDNIYKNCQACAGSGKLRRWNPVTHKYDYRDDPVCNGTGKLFWGEIIKE